MFQFLRVWSNLKTPFSQLSSDSICKISNFRRMFMYCYNTNVDTDHDTGIHHNCWHHLNSPDHNCRQRDHHNNHHINGHSDCNLDTSLRSSQRLLLFSTGATSPSQCAIRYIRSWNSLRIVLWEYFPWNFIHLFQSRQLGIFMWGIHSCIPYRQWYQQLDLWHVRSFFLATMANWKIARAIWWSGSRVQHWIWWPELHCMAVESLLNILLIWRAETWWIHLFICPWLRFICVSLL